MKHIKKNLAVLMAVMTIFANGVSLVSRAADSAAAAELDIESSVTVNDVRYIYVPEEDCYTAEAVTDTSITSVTIPAQINGKAAQVFSNIFTECAQLKEINVEEGNVHNSSIDGVLFWETHNLTAYPCAKEDISYTVPETTGSIMSAFQNCRYLQSVTFSENVQSVWALAFADCPALEEINGAVQSTGGIPVQRCPKVKHLHFKGYHPMFELVGLTALESVTCDEDTVIDMLELSELPSLKEFAIPVIQKSGYLTCSIHDCENLETVTLNNKSEFIPAKPLTISDCPKLKEIIIAHTENYATEVPVQLKNLPALEAVIYYEPQTDAIPEAENCGQFTVYGNSTNEMLKSSCEKYEIPFIALDAEPALGDINSDNEIDIMDVILLNKAIFGKAELTEAQNQKADINNDGNIDSTDCLAMMKYIIGLTDIPGK